MLIILLYALKIRVSQIRQTILIEKKNVESENNCIVITQMIIPEERS